MPNLDTLDQADIVEYFSQSSLRRAARYRGRVQDARRTGRTLNAWVKGSYLYEVEIDVRPATIEARCACPYDWGGYCKHIAAVLLKWIHQPEEFEQEQPKSLVASEGLEVVPVELPPTHRCESFPFWRQTTCDTRQAADEQELAGWLQVYKLQVLRSMIKKQGWKIKGTRKSDIIQQIVANLAKPGRMPDLIAGLDDEHCHVLCALMLLGAHDQLSANELARVAGYWGKPPQAKTVETCLRRFSDLGLLIPGHVLGNYPSSSDFIPRTVERSLSVLIGSPVPAAAEPLEEGRTDVLALADPYPLLRTLNQVALLLEQTPVSLRPPMPRPRLERLHPQLAGWDYLPAEIVAAQQHDKLRSPSQLVLSAPPPAFALPDEAIQRLAPLAGGEERLEFVYQLLLAANLIQLGSPVTVWSEIRSDFMSRDELNQRAILARVYFSMHHWSVLWNLLRQDDRLELKRRITPYLYQFERLLVSLVQFRQLVLHTLALLPDGRWVALDDLMKMMRVVWPQFDQHVWEPSRYGRTDPEWFLESAQTGQALRKGSVEDWDLAQGRFIQRMIAGPLHWLGLVDLCHADDRLTAVRFHGLADLFWDRLEFAPAPPQAPARLRAAAPAADQVQIEGLAITVDPSAVGARAHSLLDRIARLELATVDRFVYQLDAQAAYEAFEEGVSLPEILTDWDLQLPIPMPESMRDLLRQWWEAYGRVRIYENLTVIEFGDDFALSEMKAVASLDQHLIAEVSPRLVVISQDGLASLTAELEKAGYTPQQEDWLSSG